MADQEHKDPEHANSLQCDICGVKLRDTSAAQIHAEKTEHQAFSESTEEIKSLTEEEKKAKLQELREKLAAKRKLQADEELENLKKNAAIEQHECQISVDDKGKKTQESAEVIEELKRKEELKIIAAKKKEKEDDLKAKARVRAQLEQDKKDRAERTAREKAQRLGVAQVPENLASKPAAFVKPALSHSTSRLQIRFGTGKPLVRVWEKSVTMLQVASDIEAETGVDPESATFKMFGLVVKGKDLEKTLEELKLTPSASLQLS